MPRNFILRLFPPCVPVEQTEFWTLVISAGARSLTRESFPLFFFFFIADNTSHTNEGAHFSDSLGLGPLSLFT